MFSADCEEDGDCPVCGIDYGECPCIGPTEDDVEYREIDGVLWGRRLPGLTCDPEVEQDYDRSGRS